MRRGAVWSVLASSLFGAVFFLAGVIDAGPEQILGWRLVITAALFSAALVSRAGRDAVRDLVRVVAARPWACAVVVINAGLVGTQMWMFAWAPANGEAFEASLGYLLLPLALVLVGRVVFRDHVPLLQWVAVAIAIAAVATKMALSGPGSWVTAVICVGYALYFSLRRGFRLDLPASFGVECALLVPIAVALLVGTHSAAAGPSMLLLAVGVASAAAMWSYLTAARRLSLPAFGLLSYLESVLLFVAAIALGDKLEPADWVMCSLLGVALVLMALSYGPAVRSRSARRRPASPRR